MERAYLDIGFAVASIGAVYHQGHRYLTHDLLRSVTAYV